MAKTYEPIATSTLASGANSITFSSIPQTYTDLRLVWLLNGKDNTNDPGLRVNGNTGNVYCLNFFRGNGSATVATKYTAAMGTNYMYMNSASSQTIPHLYTYDIFNYTNTSYNKTMLYTATQDQNGSGTKIHFCGTYKSTAAITSLTVLIYPSGNMGVGSTATLYGIKAA